MLRTRFSGLCVAAMSVVGMVSAAQANLLGNPSFETPDASGGDVPGAPGAPWVGFNEEGLRFTVGNPDLARTGSQSLKTFGPWNIDGGVGATQTFTAAPGDIFSAEVWVYNWSSDFVRGNNFGVYKIEFRDAGGNLAAGGVLGVDVYESNQINASTPQDVWTLLGVGGVAPANTAYGQVVIVGVQLGDGNGTPQGGSIFWDDASVTLVPEPASLALLTLGGLAMRRRRA